MPEIDTRGASPRAQRAAGALLRLVSGSAGAAGALAIRLGAAGLAYLVQIVLARSLGASDYGTFSFSWSLVTIGGFLATLGFGQIAVRFLAQYHQNREFGLARGFLVAGVGATFIGSLLVALLGLAAMPLVERGYGPLCTSVLLIGIVALPFFALTDFVEGIARSQGWTIRALLPPYIVRQGGLIVLLGLGAAAGHSASAEFAMAAALGGTILAALAQVALVARPLGAVLIAAPARYALSAWSSAATPTLLSDLALLARQNIDLILLGLLASAGDVGLYFAATRIASLLGLIDFAVSAAFGHRFARAAREGGGAALHRLYREAQRLGFLPGLAAGSALVLAAPMILALFGAEFAAAAGPTRILLAAGLVRLAIGPAEDAISMAGHPAAVWRANTIGALVMAIGCLLLIRDMQAEGAALAALAGIVVSGVMLLRGLRRHLGLTFISILTGRGAA